MESTPSINSLFTLKLRKSVQYSVHFIQANLGKITSWARDVGASRDRDVETETTFLPTAASAGQKIGRVDSVDSSVCTGS